MNASRLSLTICIAVVVVLSGCAAVSQPVYKVPEGNNCSPSGVKDGKCTKFDGVPYVLPRTALKVSASVVSTTLSEGSFVSDARDIFSEKTKCAWNQKDDAKPQCKNKEFIEKLFSKGSCPALVFKNADKIGVKVAINKTYDGNSTISYKLGDISVVSEAQPDPNQVFFVEVKGKMFERRSLDISFAAGGVLNEITASAEAEIVNLVVA